MAWIYKITSSLGTMSEAEQENNALEFWKKFQNQMTLEAAAGVLGNITHESALNPGQKQQGGDGWGLIQWTPHTVLTNYATQEGGNWYDGNLQCNLINDEGYSRKGQGGRWLPTAAYPYTWDEFCNLNNVDEACRAYLYERERAGVAALDKRLEYANKWYQFLGGQPVPADIDFLILAKGVKKRRKKLI